MSRPNIANLPNCVEDVRRAALDGDSGPTDTTDFHDLHGQLFRAQPKLPALYQDAIFQPYVNTLDELGLDGFTTVLIRDPNKERTAGLMLDVAHAVLQNGERYEELATDGFQEVVSDLYDGFLSEEDGRGVKPPDKGVIPPLVKRGNPDFGSYMFTLQAASMFGCKVRGGCCQCKSLVL
jgi:hypothetical protein